MSATKQQCLEAMRHVTEAWATSQNAGHICDENIYDHFCELGGVQPLRQVLVDEDED